MQGLPGGCAASRPPGSCAASLRPPARSPEPSTTPTTAPPAAAGLCSRPPSTPCPWPAPRTPSTRPSGSSARVRSIALRAEHLRPAEKAVADLARARSGHQVLYPATLAACASPCPSAGGDIRRHGRESIGWTWAAFPRHPAEARKSPTSNPARAEERERRSVWLTRRTDGLQRSPAPSSPFHWHQSRSARAAQASGRGR